MNYKERDIVIHRIGFCEITKTKDENDIIKIKSLNSRLIYKVKEKEIKLWRRAK